MKLEWPRPRVVAILLLALLVQSLVWFYLGKRFPDIAREHGPMENLQGICLLLGIMLLMVGVRNAREPGLRLTFIGVSLFYFTLLLLEFDVRPFRIAVLTLVLNGPIRDACLWIFWLLLFVAMAKQRADAVPAFRRWATSSSGVLLMLACAFWAAGRFAEELRLFASKHQNMLAEELMESHAALIMLLAAAEALRLRIAPPKAESSRILGAKEAAH